MSSQKKTNKQQQQQQQQQQKPNNKKKKKKKKKEKTDPLPTPSNHPPHSSWNGGRGGWTCVVCNRDIKVDTGLARHYRADCNTLISTQATKSKSEDFITVRYKFQTFSNP